jgi:hypothetical protein
VAIDAAKAPAGECGVENQVGRVGVIFCTNQRGTRGVHPAQLNSSLTTRFETLGGVDVTKSRLR